VATNAESVLQARERQLGSRDAWYSFKITEYEALKDFSPEEQVVGQINSINRAIILGVKNVHSSRKLIVQYEDFCKSPEETYMKLQETIRLQGCEYNLTYQGEESFDVRSRGASSSVLSACKKWNNKSYA